MNGFLGGLAVALVVSVIAWASLSSLDMAASDVFTSGQSVRLN
jgi:hypothetical protein